MAGFASLVRSLVKVADTVTSTLQVETLIYRRLSQDLGGKVNYSSVPVPVTGAASKYEKPIVTRTGQTVMSKYRVVYTKPVVIFALDKVDIPGLGSGIVQDVQGPINPETSQPFVVTVYIS